MDQVTFPALPRPSRPARATRRPPSPSRPPGRRALPTPPSGSAKRVVDLTGGLILLLLLAPLLLALAATAAARCRGEVFARLPRTGRGGATFAMLTFRTPPSSALGRLLRRHYADQLPQLINVVRGEMSLVGPRPLAPGTLDTASGAGRARLGVRPGVTGLWQISRRSELPWEEMGVLDLHYVEQYWLGLDLLILARTLPAALTGRRSPAGQACLSDTDHRPPGYSAAG